MKVIIKDIANQYGHTDGCHVAEWGELDIKNGTGRIRLMSYASKADFEAGKPSTINRDVFLTFADIVNFEPLWTELATKILSDPASAFAGGTLDDAIVE